MCSTIAMIAALAAVTSKKQTVGPFISKVKTIVSAKDAPLAVELVVRELKHELADSSRKAAIEVLQNVAQRSWLVCVTPANPGAAHVAVAFDNMSNARAKIGNTEFIFMWGDPECMREFTILIRAAFDGTLRECGTSSNTFLQVATRDGLIRVGAVDFGATLMAAKYARVYAPYPHL